MRTRLILTVIMLFVMLGILASCGNNYDEYTNDLTDEQNDELVVNETINGFQTLETSCFSCHSPNANAEAMAAPNMAEVKQVYINKYGKEQDFVDAMVAFLTDPSEDKAIMANAVKSFGIMPNMGYGKGMIQAAAGYLYQSNIEDSSWFTHSYELEKAKNLVNPEDMSYVDRGFQFAMSTKSVLGKNLKGKIKSDGTDGALEFCNLQAFHLTDSMANDLGVKIKRVSDKNRNPKNVASEDELVIIQSFKDYLVKGEEIVPTTVEEEDVVYGYYPIITNEMCLQCHGRGNDIKPSTAQLIKEKYPDDKATGYGINELRGIWVVEMKK